MDELIHRKDENGVVVLTLNRPEQRNALSQELILALIDAVVDFQQDSALRVLLLTGEGTTFCAGVDLSSRKGGATPRPLEARDQLRNNIQRLILALSDLDKPTVAAINGPAVGGGFDLALACDFRVAAEGARMAETYIRMGLIPAVGGSYFLPSMLGRSKALELLLLGDFISASEALELGLVNRVVPGSDLQAEARALADRLAQGAPLAMRLIKRAVSGAGSGSLREHLEVMASYAPLISSSDDAKEGVSAFFEKRPSAFLGR